MKNLQVRLSDDLHANLEALATEFETTNAHIVREALDVRIQSEPHAKAGKRLVAEDSGTKEKTELIIPGLTQRNK